jgi:hypothetical protein
MAQFRSGGDGHGGTLIFPIKQANAFCLATSGPARYLAYVRSLLRLRPGSKHLIQHLRIQGDSRFISRVA